MLLKFDCPSYSHQLAPCAPDQAFFRTSQLLRRQLYEGLPDPEHSPGLKEQFLLQLAGIKEAEVTDLLHLSRQSLAVGLLCGALDGLMLFLEKLPPRPWPAPAGMEGLAEELQQVVEVADQYWRGLDREALEEQVTYGRSENLASDRQDLELLQAGPLEPERLRRQFSETFRTGYGVGMVEAALVLLHHEL